MTKFADLARAAGAEIITGAQVSAITTKPASKLGRKRRAVTGVTWTDRDGGANHTSAEIVVSAADLHHTETQLLSARTGPTPSAGGIKNRADRAPSLRCWE